ncbi:MAG: oligosaccharide flippase family protein [Candidatus Latescibacterota bacterium]|nr:oligosaccharide flippase family protein [Candidatus Latescibacterota bacterium]
MRLRATATTTFAMSARGYGERVKANLLATRAIRGFLWNGSASLIQLVTFTVIYAVSDLHALGRFEWALSLVLLLAIVGELGLGAALVQLRSIEDLHFTTAFWTNCIWGTCLSLVAYFSSSQLALWFGGEDSEVFENILKLMCLIIPFAAVSSVFRARLQRNLDFAKVALSEVVSSSCFAGVVALMLWQAPKFGVMIPVIASVLREVGLLLCLWYCSRWFPLPSWRWQCLRELLRFALNFTGSRTIAYCNSKIAHAFVFLPLGPSAMAIYSFAERLTLMPLTRLATTLNRVSFPAFSQIQDDDALLRSGYVQAVQSLIITMGSLLSVIFVFAPDILSLVHMSQAYTVLRILALATFLKVIGTMVGSMFMAKGRADWSFYWSVFSLVTLLPAMYWLGVPRGIEGVAAVIALSSLLFLLISQQLANRLIGLRFWDYLKHISRPILFVSLLLLSLACVRPYLSGSEWSLLVKVVGVTTITWLVLLRLIVWDLCSVFLKRLRG